MPCHVAENPLNCVALGTGLALSTSTSSASRSCSGSEIARSARTGRSLTSIATAPPRSIRWPARRAGRQGAPHRADPSRHHRPRTDRRALRARDLAPAEPDRHRGRGGPFRRWRLIGLYLERAVPPGLSPAETAAAIHEQGGLVGSADPSTVSAPRAAARRRSAAGARCPGRCRGLRGDPQRARLSGRQPPRRGLRRDPRPARDASSDAHSVMELGVHRRSWRAPSMARRAAALLADATSSGPCLVPGPRLDARGEGTAAIRGNRRIVRGMPDPRALRCAVTAADLSAGRSSAGAGRPSTPATARPATAPALRRCSTDGDPDLSGSPARDPAAEARLPGRQRGHEQGAVPLSQAPAQPAHARLDRAAHRGAAAAGRRTARLPPGPAAASHPQRQSLVAARGPGHLLRGLPYPWLALGDPRPGRRVPAQGQGLHRDGAHQLAGQLRRAGQAGRCLPRLPAAHQHRRRS